MKNRDRYFAQTNAYDLFMLIQSNVQRRGCLCVRDMLTGKMNLCPESMRGKVGTESRLAVCGECLQKFLNEEE